MKKYIAIMVLIFITAAPAFAGGGVPLGDVVVTADRILTPADEVGSSVTVLTHQQIVESGKNTVLDVLRDVPGLEVVRSGGMGKTSSVFLRGANAEHTLVLIDGVEANDPVSPRRSFDFSDLTVDNIERIEILRGPQSTLYGSDAMGGVIEIFTRKGKGKPSISLSAEGGSFQTFRETAASAGGNDDLDYSLALSQTKTGGISAADERYGNDENDGYRNRTVSGRFGWSPMENLSFDLTGRYSNARSDLDNSGGAGGDDPNYFTIARKLFLNSGARLSLWDGRWEQRLDFSVSDSNRKYNNGTDAAHPSDSSRSSYDGTFRKISWQHDLYLSGNNTLTLGLETERENGNSSYHSESAYGPYDSAFPEKSVRTTGYYFRWAGRLVTTVGLRLDDHSRFGSRGTGRATFSYRVGSGLRIKGSYGTGFKAPSLYQLYAPAGSFGPVGNAELSPEKSRGWDAGFEQEFSGGHGRVGITYFSNRFIDLIDFDYGTGYRNLSGAATKGIEASCSFRPVSPLELHLDYTYTDTVDKSNNEDLLRRARNKLSMGTTWTLENKGELTADLRYVGPRDDMDYSAYPSKRVRLGGYTVVDLAASVPVKGRYTLFARVENLFDKRYEENRGYGAPGRAAYAGLKVRF
ncbi:MAG: TonB-dependent receptor [Deltaproteobacteria bacterium]|nr:TonB-dependent receptor [Deltaproteobacteria bacterium]